MYCLLTGMVLEQYMIILDIDTFCEISNVGLYITYFDYIGSILHPMSLFAFIETVFFPLCVWLCLCLSFMYEQHLLVILFFLHALLSGAVVVDKFNSYLSFSVFFVYLLGILILQIIF